jgi:hypothetical protein
LFRLFHSVPGVPKVPKFHLFHFFRSKSWLKMEHANNQLDSEFLGKMEQVERVENGTERNECG